MNNKPLILEIEEAKAEIINVINNAIQVHKLPCYIVEMILTEMKSQIKEGSRSELAVAREQMKQNEEVAEPTSS